jgi:hypothetical protein
MGIAVVEMQPRRHEEHEGHSWKDARQALRVCVVAVIVLGSGSHAWAGDRYALLITGASGGEQYAQKYDTWRSAFVNLFREKFDYPDDHLIVLSEDGAGARTATRENVRAALGDLRRRVQKEDVLTVIVIGHGTALDADTAKFNLVGPDLSADEWADLAKPIAGRLVFVDATAGSFPFLRRLAAPGRVILTATDSPGQQFETVLPEFLIKAFEDPSADVDKNGKISMWEAFVFASAGVKKWYDDRGRLATERPMLEDGGAAVGALARVTYLQPDAAIPASTDAELARLLKRRIELESQVDLLRVQKPTLTNQQYEAELEKLLTELARIDRQIRSKS